MRANILVGQSGGPTAAINATLAGVYKAASERKDINIVYGMRYGIKGFIDSKYIDLSSYIKNDFDIELLKRTPSSFLGSCRYRLKDFNTDDSDYKIIFNKLNELNIKYVLYIGGNDSMDTIKKLSDYAKAIQSDIRFIGVPKTIDNDLAMTDHTPGYGSAAKYISSTMKEIIRDSKVYDIKSVTVVEIMGRNAGWLTAAAALAQDDDCAGADMIYLPEKVFDTDKFLARANELISSRHNIVIAVSEGIKTADNKYVCDGLSGAGQADCFGHTMLCGTALALSDKITSELGVKSRGIVLSTLQRCASHIASLTDINESFYAGMKAVDFAAEGKTGVMVIFSRISNSPYHITISTENINLIANAEKTVPNDWINDDGTIDNIQVSQYISPLITGELAPYMVNGIVRHLVIEK